VMQFTEAGRFFGNVADGNVTLYEKAAEPKTSAKNLAERE
jgi:hypothetical protein